jgi:hypothetical protein
MEENELFGEAHEQEENGLFGRMHQAEQLNLCDVSHRRELLKSFMQYVNCTDTTNHIYGHLLEDYLKTL